MDYNAYKPKRRSAVRKFLGKLYYTYKKRLARWKIRNRLAHTQRSDLFTHIVKKHQSLLMRKLVGVDPRLQHNKIRNLSLALKSLHGLVIPPGGVFSYRYVLGKPSKREGYLPGMVLYNGKFREGIGGGICQLSNLLHRIVLHSPLTITERWRHSYDVFPDSNRKIPFGSGATCAYPFLDFQFMNETSHSYQLDIQLSSTHLVGSLRCSVPSKRSYEIIEHDHRIVSTWRGGHIRHNKLYRREYDLHTDQEIDYTHITTNNALMMYNPILHTPQSYSDNVS